MDIYMAEQLSRQLTEYYRLYTEKISRRFKAIYSNLLPEAQYLLLIIIAGKGRITAGALGTRAMMQKQQVTKGLNQLEQKGFIIRTRLPENRRIVWIEATDSAKALLDSIHASMQTELLDIFGRLDEKSFSKYMDALTTINEILKQIPPANVPSGAD